jgi:hypothetical protein
MLKNNNKKKSIRFQNAAFGTDSLKSRHNSIPDVRRTTGSGHIEENSAAVFRKRHLSLSASRQSPQAGIVTIWGVKRIISVLLIFTIYLLCRQTIQF